MAPIVWVRIQPSHKWTCIDPEPRLRGNLLYEPSTAKDGSALVRVATPLERTTGVALYQSHFASCPHADLWRKAQGAT